MKPTYEELEAKCAALAAENAGLKSAIEKHADSYIMCGYCRTERDGKNDDVCEVLDSTPATEAFLAEVRRRPWRCLPKRCMQISAVMMPASSPPSFAKECSHEHDGFRRS
ncbi:hypothetical protein ACVXG7_03060 [Enterobacter hormaechei]